LIDLTGKTVMPAQAGIHVFFIKPE